MQRNSHKGGSKMNKFIHAPISKIATSDNLRTPGWKKRVQELQPSIKAVGLQQPILVIPLKKKGPNGEIYELIYGSRRLEACKQLKHTVIRALVGSSKMTQKEKLLAKLAENDNREDLSSIEQAHAYKQIMTECKLSARDLAKEIGKTDGFVSQRLTLLKLEPAVQSAIQNESITPTHARELARVKDPKQQKQLLTRATQTQASDFKAEVDAVLNEDRDKSKPRKGRPEKKKAKSSPASTTMVFPHNEEDINNGINRMKKQLKDAEKAKNALHEAHLKGIVRGISWVMGTKGAKLPNLY